MIQDTETYKSQEDSTNSSIEAERFSVLRGSLPTTSGNVDERDYGWNLSHAVMYVAESAKNFEKSSTSLTPPQISESFSPSPSLLRSMGTIVSPQSIIGPTRIEPETLTAHSQIYRMCIMMRSYFLRKRFINHHQQQRQHQEVLTTGVAMRTRKSTRCKILCCALLKRASKIKNAA